MSFVPILLAPKNLPSGIFVQKSDKCELGEVTQYAVIAEDLRRPLPAAFNMKMIERGKITKGKDEGKKNHGRTVSVNVFNEH